MWLSFSLAFGVLVVAGALLLGWGVPFLFLFFLLFAGFAVFFVVQRARARSEPTTGGDQASVPSPGRAAEPSPPELAPRPAKSPDPDHAT
jgi:membrane protein implicated in regulation of membrane protease activity